MNSSQDSLSKNFSAHLTKMKDATQLELQLEAEYLIKRVIPLENIVKRFSMIRNIIPDGLTPITCSIESLENIGGFVFIPNGNLILTQA